MCCQDAPTRKASLDLVKVRKTTPTWKKKKTARKGERTKKSVRFARDEEVAFRHVTKAELAKLWYKREDFSFFKSDCIKTVREYVDTAGDVARLDQKKVCLRGLEQHLTRASILSRKLAITSSIRLVLEHQKIKSEPERLREVYRLMSESVRNRALTLAEFDAKLCRL